MNARRTSLCILALLAASAVIWLVIRFVPSSNIDTPPVILPTEAVTPAPSAEIGGGDSVSHPITVTADTVQAVISVLSRADSYSRTVTIEKFWSGGSNTRTVDVQVRASSARFTIQDGLNIKNILISDGKLWIWYNDSDKVFCGAASGRDADEYQALVTYEDILSLSSDRILDAGYTELDGEICIWCKAVVGAFDYETDFYVSAKTGLLMACEKYDGDKLLYRMSSTKPDITTPDESVFLPPEQADN